jgi:16S rRNA (guanine966-N2)-methyltransferase
VRIIGGELKGRRLLVPRGRKIRPTSDRVREAIFDILGPGWNFQKVLDLFAGTGSLGFEALSRGIPEVVFVEQGKGALAILRGNVKALGLRSRVWVLPLAVKRGIAVLGEKEEVFDLIFMDPPYGKGLVGKTLEEIARRGIISSTGVIVAEHSPREEIIHPLSLVLSQQRRYGDTALSFFQAVSPSP